jgi:adenylosuccinate lyase
MIYSKYLSDIELKAICSDENFISKMLQVEIALAKVQANIGIIPKEAAKEIETVLKDIKIPPETLADGMLKNGVPTIPMLKIVKQYAEIQNPKSEIRNYIHFGATSQDIIDTAHILMYQEAILIFEKRILKIIDFLK